LEKEQVGPIRQTTMLEEEPPTEPMEMKGSSMMEVV